MAVQNLREELILAGIQELYRGGLQNFSVRRVAAACGVSCATPYKHFEDRQAFLAGIVEYIRSQWRQRQTAVLEREADSTTREKLVAISVEYVRFLVENPHFRSVIMLKDDELTVRFSTGKAGLGTTSQSLVEQYCREAGLSDEAAMRKLYIIRSLIYGAALFIDNGEMPGGEAALDMVAGAISREFDLP